MRKGKVDPAVAACAREQQVRQENLYLMRQCILDARNLLKDEKMVDVQSHVLSIAVALFRQRASTVSRRGGA